MIRQLRSWTLAAPVSGPPRRSGIHGQLGATAAGAGDLSLAGVAREGPGSGGGVGAVAGRLPALQGRAAAAPLRGWGSSSSISAGRQVTLSR